MHPPPRPVRTALTSTQRPLALQPVRAAAFVAPPQAPLTAVAPPRSTSLKPLSKPQIPPASPALKRPASPHTGEQAEIPKVLI